jgi:hypothetical protein
VKGEEITNVAPHERARDEDEDEPEDEERIDGPFWMLVDERLGGDSPLERGSVTAAKIIVRAKTKT